MFNTLHKEDKKNIIAVQGSRIPSDFQDISGVAFQNYDKLDKKVYNLASVIVKNSDSKEVAGTGELVFKTSDEGMSGEHMYLNHLGHLGLGKEPETNFDLKGDASISSSVTVPRIHLQAGSSDVTAQRVPTSGDPQPERVITYGAGPWFSIQNEFTGVGQINESINKLRVRYAMCSAHIYKLELSYRFCNLRHESKALRVNGRYRYINKDHQPVLKTWHEAVIESHPVGDKTSSPVTSAIGILDLRDQFDEVNFDLDMDVELEFSALVQEKRKKNYGLDQCTLIVSTLKVD